MCIPPYTAYERSSQTPPEHYASLTETPLLLKPELFGRGHATLESAREMLRMVNSNGIGELLNQRFSREA
jgi:hypothetical protein